MAHGQPGVATWLAEETELGDDDEAVAQAYELARDLVHVTGGENPARRAILKNLEAGASPGGF